MSLSLLQSYSSSSEEENQNDDVQDEINSSSSEEDIQNGAVSKTTRSYKPLFDPTPPSSSALPSAFDAFSEVAGPPQFLNNSSSGQGNAPPQAEEAPRWRHGGRRRNRKDNNKQDLPKGAVVESKAQLVGIHERVRSDVEGNVSTGSVPQNGKRVATVGNPSAEDAAALLRMCVSCGIPKTYAHGKGMICPACGDRPPVDSDKEAVKKKGSMVKDKEKNKRMKGQSSHATWKSETEMHLRQQFD